MKLPRRPQAIGVAAFLLATGCVGGSSHPRGPVVSPTGIVYEEGTPPSDTRYSQTAALYLRSASPERALEQALQGVASQPENPIHYFLAGVSHARLGAYTEADVMWTEAQRLYPAYELEIEPERLSAWAEAFNRGTEAYAEGEVDAAIQAWFGATRLYALRPEAHWNLGMLLSQEGRQEEAAQVYREGLAGLERLPATRVLEPEELEARSGQVERGEEALAEVLLLLDAYAEAEPLLRRQLSREPGNVQVQQNLASALASQGRNQEAREIYDGLLSEAGLAEMELFNLGVALFRVGDAARAAEAFRQLTEMRPQSRDVWFNYANALLSAEAWETLVEVGDRILELDPLNENAGLIVARAHLEMGDQGEALRRLQQVDAAPVHLEGLMMRTVGPGTTVVGRVKGNEAEAGSVVQLRFIFYGDDGQLGFETVALPTPPQGEIRDFEVNFGMRANAYRYEVEELDR